MYSTLDKPINRLCQSDPVKGQINITNISKLSWSDDDGSLSNNKELRIWHNLASMTL